MRGEMLWYDSEMKHLGYIQTEEEERLVVHKNGFLPGEMPTGRCKGLDVEFEVEGEGGDRHAVGVFFPVADNPRRARTRSRATR
jgi:cold shock CspA family protein